MRRITRIPSLVGFEKKFPKILQGVGLDLLSISENTLHRWRHGSVDKNRITTWLRQFDSLGSNRWIGEALLKSIDFWPEDRILQSVELSKEVLETFDKVCMHQQQPGKSADVLANLFTKHIKPLARKFPAIQDFHEALSEPTKPDQPQRILFLEDGLFSGTESIRLLSDLIGIKPPKGRDLKTAPLADRSLLTTKPVMMLYPVATTFGIQRLREFAQKNDLPNIEINYPSPGLLEVLTESGRNALRDGKFYDLSVRNCPVNPDAHFLRPAFQNLSVWKSSDRVEQALAFCKRIGQQLMTHYLASVGYDWDIVKVQRCALGMFGMGLTVVFSHSVPKASIPLFWANGKVSLGDTSINWIPLFPNAAL
jgi:hypothetical protein